MRRVLTFALPWLRRRSRAPGQRRASASPWLAACLLVTASCAPPACSESGERDARKDVKLLVEDDGALAEAARARLVARGPSAIAVLETGLYAANPPARLRVIGTLRDIHSREAESILAHLAKHDPDASVREAAAQAISSLR